MKVAAKGWLAGVLLGALLGAWILGVGGRVAMRVIAVATTGSGGFSLGGATTVVFLGALSGAAGAAIFLVTNRLLGRRRLIGIFAFWAALVLITLRGLRPLDPLRLALFLPLIALFAGAFQAIWSKRLSSRLSER